MQTERIESSAREALIVMIRQVTRSTRQIDDDTRLFHDLSIAGDDASELLNMVQGQFGTALSGLVFDNYFPDESEALFYRRGKFLGFGRSKKELAFGHLLKIVELGHWVDP